MGALSRPEEVVALVKLRVAAGQIKRQIPPEEHWGFAYSMLQKVSRSFALVIQQLGPELRNAVSNQRLPPSSIPPTPPRESARGGLRFVDFRRNIFGVRRVCVPCGFWTRFLTAVVCDRAGVHLLPRAPCPRHRRLVLSSLMCLTLLVAVIRSSDDVFWNIWNWSVIVMFLDTVKCGYYVLISNTN